MTNLRDLYVGGTKLTDNGLEHLEGPTSLERLWIKNAKVTDEGIQKLQQALPNCKIHR